MEEWVSTAGWRPWTWRNGYWKVLDGRTAGRGFAAKLTMFNTPANKKK